MRALGAACAAALAGFALLVAADWLLELSAEARTAAIVCVGLVTAGVFLRRIARATWAGIGPLYLAAQIERFYPAFQNRLIAAVEIALSGGESSGSEDLVIRQAAEIASGVDPRKVISAELERSSVGRWLVGSLGGLVALALVMGEAFPAGAVRCLFPGTEASPLPPAFLRIEPGDVRLRESEPLVVRALLAGDAPDAVSLELEMGGVSRSIPMKRSLGERVWTGSVGGLEVSGTYRLRAEFHGRREPLVSSAYRFRLAKVPAAKEIRVAYEYPAYTRRPPRRQEGGEIDAIVGTRATIELVPSAPLKSAELVVSGGERLAMATHGAAWRGELVVSRSGSYRVEMVTEELVSGSTDEFPIVARPDGPPSCDAVTPERQPEEALSRGVIFSLRAADDVGVEEFVLVVRRREAEPGPGEVPARVVSIPVPGFVPPATDFRTEVAIPPQVLPLEPGATYSYYVRAADGRPPERQLARSDERTFLVPRPEDASPLLSRAGSRKRRPPLLEPPEPPGETQEPLGPQGASGSRGAEAPSRGLAGLSDNQERPSPSPPAGGPPPAGRPSRYASASGLRDESAAQGDHRERREGRDGGAGRPELPGQGAPRGAGTAGGGQASQGGGSGAAGGGQASQGGGSGGTGSTQPKTRREAPDATGRGEPGGGAPKAGLSEQVPRDGGMPTGRETGTGPPMPETVDEAAVADLTTAAAEARPLGSSGGAPGRGSASRSAGGRDLGAGLARARPALAGRDRIVIPKDEIPPPEAVVSRPVSRTYRALVAEYFRRLKELSAGD